MNSSEFEQRLEKISIENGNLEQNEEYIYRFRSIKSILGKHKELKNQEIYFASPEELNDPLEGFKDIFFEGDEILWKNFFRHYINCLTVYYIAIPKEYENNKEYFKIISKINVSMDYENFFEEELSKDEDKKKLEGEIIKKIYEKIFKEIIEDGTIKNSELEKIKKIYESAVNIFLKNNSVNMLIKQLSNKEKVRRDEVLLYLTLITPIAKVAIHLSRLEYENHENKNKLNDEEYHKFALYYYKKMNQLKLEEKENDNRVIKINNSINDNSNENDSFLSSSVDEELLRLENYKINNRIKNKKQRLSHIEWFLEDFPTNYIKKIEYLIYPKWYTACFMRGYGNSAIWGYYGDNHKGVCLEFKIKKENNKEVLKLENSGNPEVNLYDIDYSSKFVEFNFFYNINNLHKNQILNQWYTSGGKKSNHINKLLENEKEYCANFEKAITTKTKEWHNENECRCIIINNNENDSRKFKYSFNNLNGIIFGINTSLKDKIKIIKIVREKCKDNKREDFNFYEMQYNRETNNINRKKLKINI